MDEFSPHQKIAGLERGTNNEARRFITALEGRRVSEIEKPGTFLAVPLNEVDILLLVEAEDLLFSCCLRFSG